MKRLETEIAGIKFKSPIIMASGTFGFGSEYKDFYNLDCLGGISSKGLTLHSKEGNTGIRVWETPSGMINSIGLENPGVKYFVEHIYPDMKALGPRLLVNLGGNTEEEYLEGVELLNSIDIDFLELNISCPNVREGGMAFGLSCSSAEAITRKVVEHSDHKVMVKLSPNGDPPADLAKACEEAGADAISLVNTFQAMAIDIEKRKPVFDNLYAGLSGPCIFPIALRMVHQVVKAVDIPVIGIGGIATVEDIIAMTMAGASGVQIGMMNFSNPYIGRELTEGLIDYMEREDLNSLDEIRGIL